MDTFSVSSPATIVNYRPPDLRQRALAAVAEAEHEGQRRQQEIERLALEADATAFTERLAALGLDVTVRHGVAEVIIDGIVFRLGRCGNSPGPLVAEIAQVCCGAPAVSFPYDLVSLGEAIAASQVPCSVCTVRLYWEEKDARRANYDGHVL